MIALHCSVLDGHLLLWSEGCVPGDIRDLRRALRAIGMKVSIRKPMLKEFLAWLPHCGEERVPSSAVLGDEPDKGLKPSLKPLAITVLSLDISLCEAFFSFVRGGNIPGSGVFFGPSVLWSMQLFDTAVHLVSAERYLPSLVRGIGRWEGRWVPYPENSVASRLDILAETMPPVCRCVSAVRKTPPVTSARELHAALLHNLVDSLVRFSFVTTGRKAARPLTIHDAWMQSLSGKNPELHWERRPEIEAFARELAEWRRPLDVYARSPFSFCFRLAEPALNGKKDIWQLTFMLQLKSDPSLLLDVGDLWLPESEAARQARSYGADSAEFMLMALGQASALYPEITKGLKQKKPC
ncbi:MAG: ATP-dependent helicase, partial [Chlorobi bacterium]|nr:ATP-dependent helicase [Chlorobiota bacterium]